MNNGRHFEEKGLPFQFLVIFLARAALESAITQCEHQRLLAICERLKISEDCFVAESIRIAVVHYEQVLKL